MLCEYTLEVVATCLPDHTPAVYRCTLRATRPVAGEAVAKALAGLRGKPMFQEEFTQALHAAIGVQVETVGNHGDVRTRIVCGDV